MFVSNKTKKKSSRCRHKTAGTQKIRHQAGTELHRHERIVLAVLFSIPIRKRVFPGYHSFVRSSTTVVLSNGGDVSLMEWLQTRYTAATSHRRTGWRVEKIMSLVPTLSFGRACCPLFGSIGNLSCCAKKPDLNTCRKAQPTAVASCSAGKTMVAHRPWRLRNMTMPWRPRGAQTGLADRLQHYCCTHEGRQGG